MFLKVKTILEERVRLFHRDDSRTKVDFRTALKCIHFNRFNTEQTVNYRISLIGRDDLKYFIRPFPGKFKSGDLKCRQERVVVRRSRVKKLKTGIGFVKNVRG